MGISPKILILGEGKFCQPEGHLSLVKESTQLLQLIGLSYRVRLKPRRAGKDGPMVGGTTS